MFARVGGVGCKCTIAFISQVISYQVSPANVPTDRQTFHLTGKRSNRPANVPAHRQRFCKSAFMCLAADGLRKCPYNNFALLLQALRVRCRLFNCPFALCCYLFLGVAWLSSVRGVQQHGKALSKMLYRKCSFETRHRKCCTENGLLQMLYRKCCNENAVLEILYYRKYSIEDVVSEMLYRKYGI